MRLRSSGRLQQLLSATKETSRHDCPSCNGKNTLSITVEAGNKVFNCFKAGCQIRGAVKGEISEGYLTQVLGRSEAKPSEDKVGLDNLLPPHLWKLEDLALDVYDKSVRFLRYYNSFKAYEENRVIISYDFRDGRLIFVNQHGYRCEGGIGRAFNGNTKPKWKRYGEARYPMLIPHAGSVYEPVMQSEGVLVEDALSACAASEVMDGIALLGTNIPYSYFEFLRKYDVLYLCLDKDASAKALELQKQLASLPTKIIVRLLEKDLKYEKSNRIAGIIFPKCDG